MGQSKPSYGELERRCLQAERELAQLRAVRESESAELAAVRERESHIKQVLLAIRNVNQLIVQENDPWRLIEQACDNLTETLGYVNAWIAMFGEDRCSVRAMAASGFGGLADTLRLEMASGGFTSCMRRAMESQKIVVVEEPESECPECPLAGTYGGCAALVRTLSFSGAVYGVLAVTVPSGLAHDAEEQALFEELAGDLAFALSKIEYAGALAETERRYREIFEGSRDGFVVVDADGRIIDANHAYCEMLGYSLDELRALDSFLDITPGRWHEWEDREVWRDGLMGRGYSGVYEKEYIRKSGEIFPVELQAYAVRDDAGALLYLWGVVRDITERKRAEERLRDSEERYRVIAEYSGDYIMRYDREGRHLYGNRAALEVTGLEYGEFVGKTHREMGFPEHLCRQWEEGIARVFNTGEAETLEFEVELAQGAMCLELKLCPELDPDGAVRSVVGISRDLTKRKEAEKRLRESEELFRSFVENANDIVYSLTPEGVFTYVSPNWEVAFGEPPEQAIGRPFEPYVHPEDRRLCAAFLERVLAGQGSRSSVEYRAITARGEERWHTSKASPIHDAEGRPVQYVGIARDVTERMEAQRAIQQSEARYRALNANFPNGALFLIGPGLRYLAADGRAFEQVGLSSEDVVGRTVDEVFPELWPDIEPYTKAALAGEEVYYETPYRGRLYSNHAVPIANADGEVTQAIVVTQDITERRRAEEALADSERRYRELFENAPTGIFSSTAAGRFERVNPVMAKMLRFASPEEVVAHYADLASELYVRPRDRHVFLEQLRQEGSVEGFEFEARRIDGSRIWFNMNARAAGGAEEDGGFRIEGFVVDVTERRRAEAALSESERRYRELFENAPVGIYNTTSDGNVLAANPAMARILGYDTVEEALFQYRDLGPSLYVLPQEREEFVRRLEESGRVENFECEARGAGGRRVWLNMNARIAERFRDGSFRIEGFSTDVTSAKQAEQALRESEARFRDLLESLESIPVQGYDQERRVIYWNTASEAIYGYSREEAYGRKLEDLIFTEAMRGASVSAVEAWVAGGPPVPAGELTLRDKQGREVPVYSHHILRTTPEGKKELFCVDVDLRTLRRAEEELRRLGAAIEQSGEIVVITDSEATIQYVNPAFELVTGYAREEAVGRTPRILKSGEQDDAFYAHMWRQLSCGQTWQGRFKNKKKDGTLYTEEATISPVWSQDGQLVNYVAVKRDITRVLALEEQYRQSQKMEAIGQLTGGVAHDFNNLLQVINGGTDLALMDIEESHPARESLGEVAKAGERAAALVSQLLLFSRRQIMRPEDLNVNAVVAELLKMLRRVIGEHVFLDWTPGERLGLIHADRGMIEQVVMNLCVNARDAMSNGGTLTIETRNVFIDQDYCATHAWAEPGRYVLLQVTDTGCGMNKETLGRIFEPFFTTKQMGTGLGLATVYGIVKQHDGMISAYSEPGRGTTFKVYLPLCEQRAVDSRGDIQAPAAGGAEVILAAEDDDMVLALATRVLERAGYEVLQARNGLEAVALFERQADRIDLVLLDVVMPELGGKEAFEEMRAIRSDVKALFVSGYSDNAVHTNFVLHAGVELLQKPYAPEDLLRAVRAILGEAAEN